MPFFVCSVQDDESENEKPVKEKPLQPPRKYHKAEKPVQPHVNEVRKKHDCRFWETRQ